MNLTTLQSQFAKALNYQTSGKVCDIVEDQFSADERIQIYRNNFIVSLSEVLSITYPMVEALLGKACFAQIARQHVLTHPLMAGQVAHYGEGFMNTISLFEQVMVQVPYCREVARFEWELDIARQTQRERLPNPELAPLTQLAEINADQQAELVFHLHSGCRRFTSDYAVFDLFTAIQDQEFEQLNINQPQTGVILVDANGSVLCHKLDTNTFQLLGYLAHKQTLGAIPPFLLASLSQLMLLDLLAGFTLQKSQGENHDRDD